MRENRNTRSWTVQEISLSLVFLACLLAIFVLGSPYYAVFVTNRNPAYYLAITIFFLLMTFLLRGIEGYTKYWPVAYSFFIASFALWFLSTGILDIPRSVANPAQFLALDKLSQFLQVVLPVVVLTLLARQDLKSIYLTTGDLRRGLTFGLISFAVCAIISFILFSLGSGDYLANLKSSLPWLLLFVFANAFMEELWFRGIFLKRFKPFIGANLSVIVTAIAFGASHISATYAFPGGGVVYGIVVFVLGVIGASSMYRTDSILGAVLFHAGYDLLVLIPVLESL
jgi:membrane protease YdiL (CAAX protease family)